MLQQLVTTAFTNFGCEVLDQLRDLQSHKCRPTSRWYHECISWYHEFNSRHHEL